MSRYLTAMTECLLAQHGTLDRYIGDAILAYFGCPVRDPLHPAQACRAALAMRCRMRELNEAWLAAGLPALRMRVGINSGRIIAGNMGTRTVFHYTIVGDAVNLASRLEGVNKGYGTAMLAGQDTHQSTAGEFAWREIDWVRVKGRGQRVTIYELQADAGSLPENERALTAHYADGLAHYRGRRWALATAAFRSALVVCATDGPSLAMLERCVRFEAQPPAETWDAVVDLAEK